VTRDLSRGALRWLAALVSVAALSSGASADSEEEAATLSDPEMKRGRILFLQCRACHALTPGDNQGKIGPSLAGVFGRTAGSAEYFDAYSTALQEADHSWNAETLDQWLTAPSAMVPGTSMVFGGISDAAQRDLLIRYLEVMTAPTAD
jgi:cytochrome c